MIQAYADLAARRWRQLAFGAGLMALSGLGQTYFISLFGNDLRASLALTDGGFGGLYALATLSGAAVLSVAGPVIDRSSLVLFSWLAAAAVGGGCLLAAAATTPLVLFMRLFLLRAGGQGLMSHAAVTATIRACPGDAGKALGLIAMGSAAAEAILPSVTVAAMALAGWRWTWAGAAVVAVAGMGLSIAGLPRAARPPPRQHEAGPDPGGGPPRTPGARLLLAVALPALLAESFMSGLFFHQARLAADMGWSLSWLATCLSAFAVTQVLAGILAGPVIDRIGPVRTVQAFLVPQACGLACLCLPPSPWTAPAYLVFSAVSAAVDPVAAAAFLAVLFGAGEIGRVRARFETARIVVTSAAPFAVGRLLDLGVPLASQIPGMLAALVLATALSLAISPRSVPCLAPRS